jgi:transposase
MEYFVGLDVAMEDTSICIIDQTGKIIVETTATTDPESIYAALSQYVARIQRVGHEAGSFSPWLQVELTALGLPAVCLEAFHARSAMSAMRNKTDRTDAQAIAHIVRTGWFKQVHVKSDESYRLRLLLTHRRNLKRKFLDIENAIRHSIKTFGLKLGAVSRGNFENRVRELVGDDPLITGIADSMLRARAALWAEYLRLHQLVVHFVSRDEVCRRFMVIPGIGPISALSFKTSIDSPQRFRRSKDVGAYLGLTPRRWQSGTSVDRTGGVSKAGDGEVRTALYEAANIMMTRFQGFCALKAWGLRYAKKKGHKRACVAVARRLAVTMHAMWLDGSEFRFKSAETTKENSNKRPPQRKQKLLGVIA